MDSDIARYLNDHLAGSSSALLLIRELGERHHEPAARAFFSDLHNQCSKDREVIHGLLSSLGEETDKVTEIAAGAATRTGGLKLLWEKIETGRLGMFEALEILAIGVQGKKLLWAVCHELSPVYPEWNQYDFAGLEMEAILQRDGVEKWRKRAAADMLLQEERMSA
jgi:hypothetical protein